MIPAEIMQELDAAYLKYGREPTLLEAVMRLKTLLRLSPAEVEAAFDFHAAKHEEREIRHQYELFLLRNSPPNTQTGANRSRRGVLQSKLHGERCG
jgi:hypothetical protein